MKYGLVLAGGGVRGAYQVGVWKALRELNINICAVAGASIGSVNGALFVQGDVEKAETLWRDIALKDIVSIPEKINNMDNLFHIGNIMELIREICKNNGLDMSPLEELLNSIIDESRIMLSQIDFGIAAFSMISRSEIYKFKADIPKGKIVEYIMASACMPGFKPREIEKDKLLDGGVSNNMPVNMLLDKGIRNIITVDVKGIGVYRSFNTAGRNIIDIVCSEPNTGIMEFDSDGIAKSIRVGYLDCMKAFGRLEGDTYYIDSSDYRGSRMTYSAQLISALEKAAEIFDVDMLKVYTVRELISAVMSAYYDCAEKAGKISEDKIVKKLRSIDDNVLTAWLVNVLESGRSDFLIEKLSVIGKNYDAASAIMYFKREK